MEHTNSVVGAKHAVESVDSLARVEEVNQTEGFQKVANLNVLEHAKSGDRSVDIPRVVLYADDHRLAVIKAARRETREKRNDGRIGLSKFLSSYKSGLHTLIGVVGEPQLWPMLAVAPSRTWHYASKYCRKGGNIHQTALGGYTIDGPYTKRRGVRALVARVLRFVGA